MRFLFIGPGYPGAKGTGHGSGIGTYLRELALGLTDRGHECHVIVWGSETTDCRLPTTDHCQVVEGIKVFLLAHAYWPVLERLMPDSRDVFNVQKLTKELDREFHYDWIDIQSEEGIGIGVQRKFPHKTLLRVHTTLLQMVEYKGEAAGGRRQAGSASCCGLSRDMSYRLRREQRSLLLASRIVTSSRAHAEEIKRLHPGIVEPAVVYIGIGPGETVEQKDERAKIEDHSEVPTFLMVGTPDRRKGFDRIRPVLAAYAAKHGPCRIVIAASADEATKSAFGLSADQPGMEIVWKGHLSTDQLVAEYERATVYLHLARYESFGIPLIEAAAHGLPVVSTPVGIAPELLSGELAEFMVSGDDPVAVAGALWRAATNRASLCEHLTRRYQAEFTRDRMVDAFLRTLGRAEEKSHAVPGAGTKTRSDVAAAGKRWP